MFRYSWFVFDKRVPWAKCWKASKQTTTNIVNCKYAYLQCHIVSEPRRPKFSREIIRWPPFQRMTWPSWFWDYMALLSWLTYQHFGRMCSIFSEDGDSRFFRNVSNRLRYYKVSWEEVETVTSVETSNFVTWLANCRRRMTLQISEGCPFGSSSDFEMELKH
jgi:hypothetical protein